MTDYTKKLAAWLHDPAEKQLVLMRDPAGHEGGTSRVLRKDLAISSKAFDPRADHLAAAADRPSWPRQEGGKPYPKFEAVHFSKHAQLIHPLSGERLELPGLGLDVGVDDIKASSQAHFQSLIQDNDDRKTFLAFWRFGPEAGQHAHELGELWRMLPADSRVPDHSIWSHLDTVCAIHTALAGDEQGPDEPALLVMSFGPVQGFITQARSTSDLWAGSHLLSSLVWEAMKPIVSHLGPDAVVFPALRGVPVVDEWLMSHDAGGDAFKQLFDQIDSELLSDSTDTNPLFAASLPNKFMAIVPARQAQALAEQAVAAVRYAAKNWAMSAAEKVFDAAGVSINDTARAQVAQQLAGFPEAQWASAVWPVGQGDDYKNAKLARERLTAALDCIHPDLKQQGVLTPKVWDVITKELQLKTMAFSFNPNAGVLYPAVYELAERSLAAAKSTRSFVPVLEEGHRCTLMGEAEWLTHDRSQLGKNRKDRSAVSVWGKLADKKKTWVKRGEHLGAIATLKRLWPTLFAERVDRLVGSNIRRFVVSTHALALSTTLEKIIDGGLDTQRQAYLQALAGIAAEYEPPTLPRALTRRLRALRLPSDQERTLKCLPAMLESPPQDAATAHHVRHTVSQLLGGAPVETYYALILMDGDRMGGWLAGNEDGFKLKYRETWHTQVRAEMEMFEKRDKSLTAYLDARRPVSPGRHGAISQALNDFSTRLARHVVEDCCKGKLLYAGGDDVLALVAVDDLFDCMQLLRLAYSGIAPDERMGLSQSVGAWQGGGSSRQRQLLLSKGFGLLDGRLMTLMGNKATASMGAVVAHHSEPLSAVLRELRLAESTAKNTNHGSDNRDAFCLRVLKRGGGEVSVTSPWWPVAEQKPDTSKSALALMKKLADQLALTAFSRGAIYDAQLWFAGLTDNTDDVNNQVWREQIAAALAYQFDRKSGDAETAKQVIDFVCDVIKPKHPRTAVENFLITSEFFAREARSFKDRARAVKAAISANTARGDIPEQTATAGEFA